MFWEKYFLDIVLLGVSIYLLHNFNQEIDKIRARALLGTKMDPLIFLDSVLFIVAMGLVVLRLLHYLVQLVYHIGRKSGVRQCTRRSCRSRGTSASRDLSRYF